MATKKGILSATTGLLSFALAYWILDSSKLFYCINIGFVLSLISLLLFHAIKKIKWESIVKKDFLKIFFIIIFFSLISLPIIDQLTNLTKGDNTQPKLNEKRVLAEYKSLDEIAMNKFPSSFTDYYNDNFGLRNLLISNNNYFKTIHFGMSSNDNVIIGNGGWMFYNNSNSLNDHLGKVQLSSKQLSNIKKNLLARKKYLSSKGIKYYVAFFPDKMGVYKDNMPSDFQLVDTTRWDQLITYLKGSGLEIVDVRKPMRKSKESGVHLYQKSDSHWNHNGALIASTEIIKTLKKDFPKIPSPKNIDDYEIKEESKRDGGDLSDLLGVKSYLNKRWFHYTLKNDKNPKVSEIIKEYQFYKEPYKATFSFKKPIDAPSLLVFNDSFISYIYAHLGDYFSESNFFWTYDFRKDLIEKESPDIVLSMLVERQILELGKDPL